MKKIFSYVGLGAFMIFSFYFTERIALLARSKDPMLEQIKEYDKNNTEAVNAIIKDETIIPGRYGKEIDEVKSLMNIKKAGSFSENFLVYKSIPPKISLKDNLDKVIIGGNEDKKSVALVLEYNEELIKHLLNKNVAFSVLINYDNFTEDGKYEVINNEEEENYKRLDKLLDKSNLNTNICLDNSYCPKYKYIVRASYELTKNNIIEVKNKVKSGEIIRVNKDSKREDLDILIQQIYSRNLTLVPLSKLISEEA